jgi:hypothetical protein
MKCENIRSLKLSHRERLLGSPVRLYRPCKQRLFHSHVRICFDIYSTATSNYITAYITQIQHPQRVKKN